MGDSIVPVESAEGRARLRRGADALTRHAFEPWRYGDSIAFEGLLAASDLCRDSDYIDWVHNTLRAWAVHPGPFKERDDTAPGHAMCLIFERSGDRVILEAALRLGEFLSRRRVVEDAFVSFELSPIREPFGGADLTQEDIELLRAPGAGVFLNHLHFVGAFFAHLGAVSGNARFLDLAARQTLAHLALLQSDDGLLWHFWLEKTRQRYGFGWGRGQTWALLGLLEMLAYVPQSHPTYVPIRTAFVRLAEAVADRQDPSGGWPTLLTDAAAPLETSSAAFAAAAFGRGVRSGLLGARFREVAKRAWKFAWSHVDNTGVLTGVSVNVGASTLSSHYLYTPFGSLVTWGQGPLLLADKEIAEL